MLRRTLQAMTAAAIAIAACAITPLSATAAPELPIDVDLAHGFSVKNADIKTGTTVIWKNIEPLPLEQMAHTVVADNGSFDSGSLIPGARFTYTFNNPGTFTYKCTVHPQLMTAAVNVTGAAIQPPKLEKTVRMVEPSASNSTSWKFDPKDVLGQVGLKVTWRNDGAQPHDVTTDDGSIKSPELASGESWTYTFKKAVSLNYKCSLHPWMTGTMRIAGANGEAPPPPPPPPSNNDNPSFDDEDFSNSGGAPAAGSGPMTFKVGIVEPSVSDVNSWTYKPNTLNARVGDTVIWQNAGQAPHTATANDKSFDTGNLNAGDEFSLKLSKEGSFGYICTLHPWMKGTLVVAAAGSVAPVGNDTGTDTSGETPGTGAGEENEGSESTDGEHVAKPVPPERRQLAIWVLVASAIMTAGMLFGTRKDRAPSSPTPGRTIDLTEEPQTQEEQELALV